MDTLDRIVSKMEIDPVTGCFGFMGGLTAAGYGQINVKGKVLLTHRVVYEAVVGEIPKGYDIDHICQETDCFNPDHLQAIPRGEHVRITHDRLNSDTQFRCGHPKTSDNISYHRGSRDNMRCRTCHRLGRC